MFISIHVTVDDVDCCDGLECVYVKYKSRAAKARESPDSYMGFCRLLIRCYTAFYAIIVVYRFNSLPEPSSCDEKEIKPFL